MNEKIEKKELVHTVRDGETRKKIGVFISDGPGRYGWAMLSRKDQWNQKVGRAVAHGRLEKTPQVPPQRLFPAFVQFVEKAGRYWPREEEKRDV